jgi:hypothetical protein
MDNRETSLEGVDWIPLVQDRDRWRFVVKAVINIRASWKAELFFTPSETVSLSRRMCLMELFKGPGCRQDDWVRF